MNQPQSSSQTTPGVIWEPWEELMKSPGSHPTKPQQHRILGGYVELCKLVDEVWPDRGPEVTFPMILKRVRDMRILYMQKELEDETTERILASIISEHT